MKKEIYLTILCILIFSITCALLAVNIFQGKLVAEQNRIIAKQAEYQFELESTMRTQGKIIRDQDQVLGAYESVINVHNLMTEVKDE